MTGKTKKKPFSMERLATILLVNFMSVSMATMMFVHHTLLAIPGSVSGQVMHMIVFGIFAIGLTLYCAIQIFQIRKMMTEHVSDMVGVEVRKIIGDKSISTKLEASVDKVITNRIENKNFRLEQVPDVSISTPSNNCHGLAVEKSAT